MATEDVSSDRGSAFGRPLNRRRLLRIALIALASIVGLIVLVAAVIAIRLAIGPVSIMMFAETIQEKLSERLYYAYRVEFDEATLGWRDGGIELRFSSIRVRDYSSEVIATIPAIAARGGPVAFLGGDGAIKSIMVERPKVRWLESPGGAVRFDLGADRPGKSGKILEDFLITLASAPDPSESVKPLPSIEAVGADILIADEGRNTSYHVTNARIAALPVREGVRARYEFDLDLGSKTAHFTAESLYRTDNQRITLTLHFADLAPSDLKGALPMPDWVADINAPFSGVTEFDMDRLFHIGRIDLEAASWRMGLAVTTQIKEDRTLVEGTAFFSRDSAPELAASWPAQIQGNVPQWLRVLGPEVQALRIKAAGELKKGLFAIGGRIEPGGENVELDGTVEQPRLTIDPNPHQ